MVRKGMVAAEQTVLLQPPHEVDVARIEQELLQLWKAASEENDQSGSPPVTRACALNFIVVTEQAGELDAIADIVGEVTVEHPSRTMLIALNRQAPTPSLEAWISARCSLPQPGGRQVCCEQITMRANGSDVDKVASIVTSLLVADVPTVVLWKTRVDGQGPLLRALVEIADRVLIDSSELPAPAPMLHAWQQLIEEHGDRVSFCDLAWTHLTPWRSHLAHAFQSPETGKGLTSIWSVTVRYSSTVQPQHSGLSQSLLLIGWLASRLQWTLGAELHTDSNGGHSVGFVREGRPIACRVIPALPLLGKAGGIVSVAIHTREGVQEFGHTMGYEREATLVAQELEVLQRDEVYEAALAGLLASGR